MVDEVDESLKTLTLINPTREESWKNAIAKWVFFSARLSRTHHLARLQKDKANKPTTLIAVCGGTLGSAPWKVVTLIFVPLEATGAGKSSILNAVLDGMCL